MDLNTIGRNVDSYLGMIERFVRLDVSNFQFVYFNLVLFVLIYLSLYIFGIV